MEKTGFFLKVRLIKAFFLLLSLAVLLRLFYWQFLSSEKLSILAENQYYAREEITSLRGEILSSDRFPLVSNEPVYLLYVLRNRLRAPPQKIASLLGPIFLELEEEASPTASLNKREKLLNLEEEIKVELSQEGLVWVPLRHKIPKEKKEEIESLGIAGLNFEEESERVYPEASTAAHLLGFLGQNEAGQPTGYFGLEGFYNLELKGRAGVMMQEQDAAGRPILFAGLLRQDRVDGSSLKLHLDRATQVMVEGKLKKALEKYGAKAGSVVISDPQTGAILAMTSLPGYEPGDFQKYDKALFKNPVIADFYEPGSTFKVVTMASALDQKAVRPETKCDICEGPLKIDKYWIRTWNDKYYPGCNMIEVIEHSDNIGMVFVGRKLGLEKFLSYLKLFGIDRVTGIDLQEETAPPWRPEEKWSEVDLATAAFGQGIAVTRMQMLQVINVIANEGKLVAPKVVDEIESNKGKIKKEVKVTRKVIKPETARVLTEMLVNAVDNGEAKWAKPRGFKIAGKTGTSQIPIAGHYDEEKTIASFIGFAPADEPVFSMLVTLREPTSSPWGSETAAPLWFEIAKELFVYFNIQPE